MNSKNTLLTRQSEKNPVKPSYNNNQEIFSVLSNKNIPIKIINIKGGKVLCLPKIIYHEDKNDREKGIMGINTKIIGTIGGYFDKYTCSLSLFMNLIYSLAKNSAEHTKGKAYFELKILCPDHGNFKKIIFAFNDQGLGLAHSYKKFLEGIRRTNAINYEMMFKNYRTTKTEGGMGLINIKELANVINLNLLYCDNTTNIVVNEGSDIEYAKKLRNTFKFPNGPCCFKGEFTCKKY